MGCLQRMRNNTTACRLSLVGSGRCLQSLGLACDFFMTVGTDFAALPVALQQ